MDGNHNLNKAISGFQAQVTNKNLTKFVNNIDHHLLLSLIDFNIEHKIYNESSLLKQKLRILQNTHLHEQAQKTASQLGDDSSKDQIAQMKENSESKQSTLKEQADKILKAFDSEEFAAKAQGKKAADVMSEFDISDKEKQAAFDYSKYLYEAGQYKQSEELLSKYIKIWKSNTFLSSYWGLLNCQILTGSHERALETFKELREIVHKEKLSDIDRIAARNMLLNTSLFVFHVEENPGEFLLDLFRQNESVLASGSIHLLRYYIVAALLTGNLDMLNGSIMQLIQSDSYRYRDSFTIFIESLLDQFNYEACNDLIKELETTIESDYFLRSMKSRIIDAAKGLILSVYGMIHHEDDVKAFAEKIGSDAGSKDSFRSEQQSHTSLNDRLKEITKAQVELKDVLQHVL